ncbi:transcriptional regulator [Longimycelium tulufanense]|uniref:Transcriptional regulator n=1 Tax=Longimycelium tulufanense TaxID=907463 RepID=A0A8J3FV93_9PSEU|nr:sugar-binding domain-containing protein [Longimycelium tulufanense]GGM49858.1 transcriptional regulator [Longimycelium tulufanense]
MAENRLEDAVRAVRMHYLQDMTMEAIAREMGVSRSTVSRLISFARESGLIEFRLHLPDEHVPNIEQRIGTQFGITAHVVPVPDTVSELERLERTAMVAARVLNNLFGSDMVLAVAWGNTVEAISRRLVPKTTHNSQIVQLNGAGSTEATGISYASEILSRFGKAYGARIEQFLVPAFFDYADTKRALWRERSVRRILDLQRRADVALFSIGSSTGDVPSHVYRAGYLNKAELRTLKQQDVAGDIATVFFRRDGSSTGIELNERASGPNLSTLKRLRRRLCVAAGNHKLPGLRAALEGGLITDLVIDDGTARRLLT